MRRCLRLPGSQATSEMITGSRTGGQTLSEYRAEYAEPIRKWATGMGMSVTARRGRKPETASLRTLKEFSRHRENSKYDINLIHGDISSVARMQ